MLKFEILGADDSVSEIITSDKTTIKVGKMSTNNLILNDASVGPVHAQIDVIDANTLKVKDRGSVGGTYINDEQVPKSKDATFPVGAVLRFGKVKVRVTAEADAPVETTPNPDESDLGVKLSAAPSAAPAAAAPAAAAAKPGFAGKAGGFNTAAQPSGPKKIIRRKRPVSYERRFLSEKCPECNGSVEVALIWREQVISLKDLSKVNKPFTIGSMTSGANRVDLGIEDNRLGGSKVLLVKQADKWFLHFETSYDGFLVVDPNKFGQEKVMLRDCKPNDAQGITVASVNGVVNNNALAIQIDGMTRAKLTFGEVSVLVHMSKQPVGAVLPVKAGINTSFAASAVASFFIHFSLLSIMLFATDRVDALMIDRILTTSRFAEALVQPEEVVEEEEVDEEDEQEPEDPVEESDVKADSEPTPFAATSASAGSGDSSAGSGMSREAAVGVAQSTGLLAQANAMNSMLAVGANLDNMDLDWSSFDANAAAASAGYGMGMVGGGGGGAAMGGFGAGGFGPGGRGGGGAVGAAARGHVGSLGEKGAAAPKMKALNPDVTGSLDKRVIQKVVRQHTGELRACYERELAKVKGLNGKIGMTWLIAQDGSVAKVFVKETTMKNKNVENCIADSIKHWRFPAPKGGGMAQVVYPFVFESGGSN